MYHWNSTEIPKKEGHSSFFFSVFASTLFFSNSGLDLDDTRGFFPLASVDCRFSILWRLCRHSLYRFSLSVKRVQCWLCIVLRTLLNCFSSGVSRRVDVLLSLIFIFSFSLVVSLGRPVSIFPSHTLAFEMWLKSFLASSTDDVFVGNMPPKPSRSLNFLLFLLFHKRLWR